MRLSSGCLGIFGFIILIIATVVCSVVSFGFTRDRVVEAWASGQEIESPLEVVQAITNPEDFTSVSATTTPLVIPTFTPTQASTTIASAPTATSTTTAATAGEAVLPTFTPLPPASATPDLAAQALQQVGPREINILLMGIDERVGFTRERAYATDTMMVVHVDPVRKTAGVISFPRDLWVDIPGYEPDRLNNANLIGDNNAYPDGGGPGLAMEAFRTNFGIRIDYYIMVNFTVFETVVDIIAPNGVEVCVRETIRDPDYPDAGFGTINVEFDPGCQPLDGERLLQYARTRATQGGDLDRARRQQETIEALRQHVLSAGGVQSFVTQIGRLWTELADSYRTNLQLDEIVGLAYLMNDIPRENIIYNVIGSGYVDPRQTQDGTKQILVPIYSRIQTLIQETFYPEIDVDVADLRARALAEDADVYVYNNTSDVFGLAGRTREWLVSRGAQVTGIGNMPTPSNQETIILNYGGGTNTARWLAEVMGLPPDRIQRRNDGLVTSGVVVAVGSDADSIIAGQ